MEVEKPYIQPPKQPFSSITESTHSHSLDKTGTVLRDIPKLSTIAAVANLAVHQPIVHPGWENGHV